MGYWSCSFCRSESRRGVGRGFERRDRLSEAIGRLMMNSSMMNPSANGDLFQKIRPIGGVLFGRLGVRVDAELDDEPLALPMPVVDHRLRQLEGGRHKQRRGVGQDVLFEKVHVVMAERLDGRIEAQSAVDQVGDGLHDEPLDPSRPLAGDVNVVLPLFDVTDTLGRFGVCHTMIDDRVGRCRIVENDGDGAAPLALRRKENPAVIGPTE